MTSQHPLQVLQVSQIDPSDLHGDLLQRVIVLPGAPQDPYIRVRAGHVHPAVHPVGIGHAAGGPAGEPESALELVSTCPVGATLRGGEDHAIQGTQGVSCGVEDSPLSTNTVSYAEYQDT